MIGLKLASYQREPRTTEWQDFWKSISARYGDHIFFDPKYCDFGGPGVPTTFHYPWWAFISRFVSRWRARFHLISKTFSTEYGWLFYEDNYGFVDFRKDVSFGEKVQSNFWQRLFYVVKTLLCILFFYDRSPESNSAYYDTMVVACWDFHPYVGEYSGSEWSELVVGRGVFRNWFFREFSDSSV